MGTCSSVPRDLREPGDQALLRSIHGCHFVDDDPICIEPKQDIHIYLEVLATPGKLLFRSDSGHTRSNPKEVDVWWADTAAWSADDYGFSTIPGKLSNKEKPDVEYKLEQPTWIFRDARNSPWCILRGQEHPTIQLFHSPGYIIRGETYTEPIGQKLRGHKEKDDRFLDELFEHRELADLAQAQSYLLNTHKQISQDVRSRAEKVLEEAEELTRRVSGGTECSFYFVLAEHVRSCEDKTLPPFQKLKEQWPGCLVKRTLRLKDGCSGAYAAEILAVSHRWETSDVPDVKGVQMDCVRKYLQEHAEIKLVWYDYWCMPQGKRTEPEKREFKLMLPNINMIYLGCSVLLLVDLSYMSRFWTEFEAWLSMQVASESGLRTTADKGGRFTINAIHSAPPMFERFMVDMWAGKSVEEAYDFLAQPDVTVTNQGDKDLQLAKLAKLNELVKTVLADP